MTDHVPHRGIAGRKRGWALAAVASLVAVWFPTHAGVRAAPDPGPTVMLWAWERPEDLRFLDPEQTGIAYLETTVTLRGDEVALSPRMQPLRVPDGAFVEAVVRVEVDGRSPPTLSTGQRQVLADAMVAAADGPGVRGVQVDFDATAGQRPFYAALLHDVRARLPAGTGLSMTALASWCLGDPWLADLPVDAAVPMLFEMGPDAGTIRRHLAGGGDFRPRVCRDAVGLATDEPVPGTPRGRRTYLFHHTSWSARALADAAVEVMP
jgi:Protein of unknown function (DUF3142)